MLDDNQLDDKIKNICEELGKLATRKKELEESSLPLDIIERQNLLRKFEQTEDNLKKIWVFL